MALFFALFASLLCTVAAIPALSFLQANVNKIRAPLSPDIENEKLPGPPGAVSLATLANAVRDHPVKFFLYNLDKFEPRFDGKELKKCERKGADYMFLEKLVNSENRVYDSKEAEVVVVPCLFESYRRCTTKNHAEKPPEAFIQRHKDFNPDDHPEDFEDIPWVKAFDYDTEQCLNQVMATETFKAKNGADHIWVVADWAINFGRASESELFKQMSIGRIEVVNEESAKTSNRPMAVDQSRCSFVVPYASDVAYSEEWDAAPSFKKWKKRKHTVNFRFEDRDYVLFCKANPCEGAVDATPLRKKSLELAEYFGDKALITMERVPMEQFSEELHDAKFCLVMRGDTPSSHSFYDALAANCIPILVSDDWEVVSGPFAAGEHGNLGGGITHKEYILRVSEKKFMEDAPAIAKRIERLLADDQRLEELFDHMQNHRHALLWSMPGNRVSEFALQGARRCVHSK